MERSLSQAMFTVSVDNEGLIKELIRKFGDIVFDVAENSSVVFSLCSTDNLLFASKGDGFVIQPDKNLTLVTTNDLPSYEEIAYGLIDKEIPRIYFKKKDEKMGLYLRLTCESERKK